MSISSCAATSTIIESLNTLASAKPIDAATKTTVAPIQSPAPMKNSNAVATAPVMAKTISPFLRAPLRSAMAPNRGADNATSTAAALLAAPSRNVDTVTSAPALQCCLKKIGNKPAMTVVANAELPQS